MKKALIFLGTSALFLVPLTGFAAEGFFGSIVPDRVLQCAPYCEACDLVALFDNVLRFAVYFSAIVATLMFTYAGFLYVTASAKQDNITQAKKIFGDVFTGFVFILGAWLIINVIMSIFVEEKAYPWNEIECEGYRDVTVFVPGPPGIDSSIPGGSGGYAQVPADTLLSHSDALDALQKAGVDVTSTSGPDGVQSGCIGDGCTSLRGIQERTVEQVIALKEGCGVDCKVIVTGGTERGVHATNGGHEKGYKVDLEDTPSLNKYIEESGKFTRSGTQNGYPAYKDSCGNTYLKEDDHWDVLVISKCSG